MKHGSLFSGIGGFDLAAEWMGWENIFHCEWNSFGQKVLKHYWPKAISYNDITKTDFSIHRGQIDILTGGFPCQPYSGAGKRLGTADTRHLWPEMLRAIREIQPSYVVGENVRGLTNWNGGMVFDQVQAELENEGFEVLPFLLPACAVNAPHRRDRIWFIAHSNVRRNDRSERAEDGYDEREQSENNIKSRNGRTSEIKRYGEVGIASNGNEIGCNREQSSVDRWNESFQNNGTKIWNIDQSNGDEQNVTNPDSDGQNICNSEYEINASERGFNALNDIEQVSMHTNSASEQGKYIRQEGQGKLNRSDSRNGINDWKDFPTQSPICLRNDGLSERLDGITFPKWREQSIMAAGNAIVPQVAFQIFKAIQETN